MAQCTEICTYRASEEWLNNIVYKYFLIEDSKTIRLDDLSVDLRSYGIKVAKVKAVEGYSTIVEENTVEDISPNVDKVVELIDFLRSHGVSPVHLLDVIGDIVDEWVVDFDQAVLMEAGKNIYCH